MTPFLHYIACWYPDPEPARAAEISAAVGEQCYEPLLRSTAVLAQGPGCPIPAGRIDHRPAFAELLALGRAEPEIVNLLTNADCWVDHDHAAWLARVRPGEIWCLSRTDNRSAASQDAWAWRGRLEVPAAGFAQGRLGCDNRLAFEAAAAGRTPRNPSLSIDLHHRHAAAARRYTAGDRLPPPYLFVAPEFLGAPRPRLEYRGPAGSKRLIPHLADCLEDLRV